jgi:UDP-N-acetylmuramoyl-tripeptide--D-alanyl-D-alanine ligase
LLRIDDQTEMAVIEMGANHPGDIDQLCRIADPDFGIITNIGKAHLEGFGSYEGVIQTKTELYRYLEKKAGKVFVNSGDLLLMKHAGNLFKIGYGPDAAQARLIAADATPYAEIDIELSGTHGIRIQSQLYGEYNSANMLAAACIGSYFGVPPSDIQSAISGYRPVNNRSQVIKTERNTLISDAYNANPASMELALGSFSKSGTGEKMLILGDMLELGQASEEEHIHILQLVDQLSFSQVCLVGPVFCRVNKRRENLCFQDSELARLWLEHHRPEGLTILLKGSRGIRLEKVAEVL